MKTTNAPCQTRKIQPEANVCAVCVCIQHLIYGCVYKFIWSSLIAA